MLKSAVIKVSLKEPQGRVAEMMGAMRSLGTEEVHLVHVRGQGAGYEKQRAKLEVLREDAVELGLTAEVHIPEGHAPTRVLQAAFHLDADYISIPWVKKAILRQALMGSIDDDILRMSDTPVLIFKQGLFSRTQSLDSILYATDFRATDAKVMPYLKDRDFKARALYMLHVRERAPDPDTDTARSRAVLDNLRRLAAECAHAYDEIEHLEAVGSTRKQIVRQSRVLGVDLIVAGKADNPDMLDNILGSTVEHLAHRAACSLFVVPGHKPAEKRAREAGP